MKLVLDTNVVIDWLVFDAPYMNPLRFAVAVNKVEVITHAPALAELHRVLGYPTLKLGAARQKDVFRHYSVHARLAVTKNESPGEAALPRAFPRCRDPDDNHFLELALHAKADALVSRDNALLKLKRRTARFGFEILDVQQMITAVQAL
jgi:putative PIN family toxin of toxin-antitoxin system